MQGLLDSGVDDLSAYYAREISGLRIAGPAGLNLSSGALALEARLFGSPRSGLGGFWCVAFRGGSLQSNAAES